MSTPEHFAEDGNLLRQEVVANLCLEMMHVSTASSGERRGRVGEKWPPLAVQQQRLPHHGPMRRLGMGILEMSMWPARVANHSSRRFRRASTNAWNVAVSVFSTSIGVWSTGGKSAATRIVLIGIRCSAFS